MSDEPVTCLVFLQRKSSSGRIAVMRGRNLQNLTSITNLSCATLIDWLHSGTEPHRPDASRPYKRALCAPCQIREPRFFAKVPDGPQAYTLNILRLQKKGAQMPMSEWGQGLTITKNVSRGFLFYSTPPTQCTVQQPSRWRRLRSVMSSKKASYNPGLSPIKGQKFSVGTQSRSRD